SAPIDDTYTDEQVFKMLDDVINFTKDPNYVPEQEEQQLETASLSEGLKSAEKAAAAQGVTLGKSAIADYIENNYAGRVKCFRRPNQTPISARNGKSLPLADTHFIAVGNKLVCFSYVYQTADGGLLLILKTSEQHAKLLKKSHPLVAVSKYPKSSTPWYGVAIDDTFTNEQVYQMIDDTIKVVENPQYIVSDPDEEVEELKELSLSESLESSKTEHSGVSVGKGALADYLENKYGDEVKCNRRPNQTPISARNGKSLPLADTHYVNAGKKPICFVYVYETEDGGLLLLLKTSEQHAKALKKSHPLVAISKYPKAGSAVWYSVIIDGTFNDEQVYEMLDETIKSCKDANYVAEVKPSKKEEKPVEEPVTEPQKEETAEEATEEVEEEPVVEVVEEVSVYQVNAMMNDDTAVKLQKQSDRKANKAIKAIVNIDTISHYFVAGETVTLDELKKRLPNFNKKVTYVKVLGRGKIDKPLTVDLDEYSMEAAKMIILTGGTVLKPEK
ncbi:MAG: uL15 family ribosomal protein, partial [Clostridia bacterium]|nr:uL15 family ribosomal protein [Clostridia bacterium]